MDGGEPQRFSNGRIAYHWGTFYPDLDGWVQAARRRVLAWGFNTAGGWSLHPTLLKLPITPNLELGRTAQFHWFDPFDPATAERCRTSARSRFDLDSVGGAGYRRLYERLLKGRESSIVNRQS